VEAEEEVVAEELLPLRKPPLKKKKLRRLPQLLICSAPAVSSTHQLLSLIECCHLCFIVI